MNRNVIKGVDVRDIQFQKSVNGMKAENCQTGAWLVWDTAGTIGRGGPDRIFSYSFVDESGAKTMFYCVHTHKEHGKITEYIKELYFYNACKKFEPNESERLNYLKQLFPYFGQLGSGGRYDGSYSNNERRTLILGRTIVTDMKIGSDYLSK